ncbi:MAG: hypothetical protein AAFO69_11045, partial [Bacteroidota bacterium]
YRMMRTKILLGVLLSIVTISASLASVGKDDTRLTKNITKSFAVNDNVEVDITNKYGKVVVNAWDKDSVKISVDIIAYGKNDDAVDKLIKKVAIDFMHSANYVSAETEMNKRGGSFGSLLSNIEGYSKSILNNNKLTVNYTIQVPANAVLDLENKFGDIFLGDTFKDADIELSNGDLKARELIGESSIRISFGNAKIKQIKNGFIKLKGGEVEVDEGTTLKVESSSSELIFGDIKSLSINSRNDKIRANSLQQLSGSGDFTDIFVTSVAETMELNLEYGELFVERIGENFNNITLNSKSADINLVLSPKSYFTANISGNEDRMIVPNNMLSLGKKDNSGTDYDFTLSGSVGYTRDQVGKVNIKAVSADVIISIKETSIFTKKN